MKGSTEPGSPQRRKLVQPTPNTTEMLRAKWEKAEGATVKSQRENIGDGAVARWWES
jgi:hypothetical protein